MKNIFLIGLIGIGILVSCNGPMKKVTLYNKPTGLEQISGLSASPFFNGSVEGTPAFIFYGKSPVHTNTYGDRGISFLNFEMSSGPVSLKVGSPFQIDSIHIKPEMDFEETANHAFDIQIKEPSKFLITAYIKDQGRQDFMVSAEMPDWEKPSKDAKGVLYLEPGLHRFGENWNPFQNGIHTLYLEGGAIVEATLDVRNANEVNIEGRGIFAQAFAANNTLGEEHKAGIQISDAKRVRINGITMVNSPGKQLQVNNANEFFGDNIKLYGFGGNHNSGLHPYSRNVQISNSIICANADRVCLNGQYSGGPEHKVKMGNIVENVRLSKLILWGVQNGADIMLAQHANKDTRTVFIEDCYSMEATNEAFVSSKQKGTGGIYDIVVTNSHICHGKLLNLSIAKANEAHSDGAYMRDLVLDNITLDAAAKDVEIHLQGASESSNIKGLILNHIVANGKIIKSFTETDFRQNEFVKELTLN